MSEQIRDQISAFTDDELSAEECAFLVRQLERNPASRQRVLRYSIMGAALRGELLNPDPDILRRRVRAGFAGVRSVRRPRHSRAALNGLMRWSAAGFGVAAAVAAAALFVVYGVNPPYTFDDASAGMARTAASLPEEPVGSYAAPQAAVDHVVPPGNSPLAAPPIRLTNYLITHGEYASGIGRTSIHTDVISHQEAAWVLAPPSPAQEP